MLRIRGGARVFLLLLALEFAAQAQEATSPVPASLRGGWVELGLYMLDHYWVQIGALFGASGGGLLAMFRGWRPSLPVLTVRLVVAVEGPVEVVQRRRVTRPAPPSEVEVLEDASDPTPESRTPVALRPRGTLPPRRGRE